MKKSEKNKSVFKSIKETHRFLFQTLVERKILPEDEAGAFVYALIDISESIEKVYFDIIPALLKNRGRNELLKNLLWDVREEFRHIQYHITDAKLTEL